MKVVVLIGCPGSGKSTLATTQFAHLTRINQDELGSREACLKALNEALARGESCVIDRCNQTPRQRSQWIKMARVYGASVHAVYLDVSAKVASKRIFERKNHPTIQDYSLAKCEQIVRKFLNETVVPSFDEDLDSILLVRSK